MSRIRNANTESDSYIQLCEGLADRRDHLGLSQTEISDILGYKHANIISMIERGKTTIPPAKAALFAKAYNLDPALFIKAFLKAMLPDIWKLFLIVIENDHKLSEKNKATIEDEVDTFVENMGKFTYEQTK